MLAVNRIIGIVLLVLGAWVVIQPTIFTILYGVSLATSESRSTIRAVIGGTEIALGILFVFPSLFQINEHTLLRLGALVFGCIFFGRIYHVLFDDAVQFSLIRESLIEGLIALLLTACAIRYRNTKDPTN